MITRMKSVLEQIDANLSEIGLQLEHGKTNLVAFDYGKSNTGNARIKIGDAIIESCESARFLGVIFDKKLKFEAQISNVIGKASKAIDILRYPNSISWGMEVNTALIMYKSYVRSITDYGAFIFYPKHIRSCMKLERVQFKGVRTALGYRNSTPTNVMMEEAKLPYVQDRASWKKFLAEDI